VTAREITLQPPGGTGNLIIGLGGDPIVREWQYWTQNKLSILAGYFLPSMSHPRSPLNGCTST
jgi:hypothetical protein